MQLFLYRPTGRELQHQPPSIVEVITVFVLTVGAGVAAGLSAHYKFGQTHDHSMNWAAGAIVASLLAWILVRSFLVREGLVHPMGTVENRKNHTCCSKRS